MTCVECEESAAVMEDPRDPPVELGDCLCRDCGEAALNDRIDELETELDELRVELKTLKKEAKA